MPSATPLPQRLLEHYNAMPRAERRLACCSRMSAR